MLPLSTSLPALPLASNPQTPDYDHELEQLEEERHHLLAENAELKTEISRERSRFERICLADDKSGAKRKLLPLRELIAEQYESSSHLLAKSSERAHALEVAKRRLNIEGELQERREDDGAVHSEQLEKLTNDFESAVAHADLACFTFDQYSMLERRLHTLKAEDQARITDITRVEEECLQRVNQWLAVAKEGETDLAQAESELAHMRAGYKAERQQQRRMIGERRTLVNSMVKYTEDRQQRMQAHRDKLLSQSGDLDASQEDSLAKVAGTIETARRLNENAARHAMTHEERCEEAGKAPLPAKTAHPFLSCRQERLPSQIRQPTPPFHPSCRHYTRSSRSQGRRT